MTLIDQGDSGSGTECLSWILGLAKSGQLLTEFKHDPARVILCVAHIVAAVSRRFVTEDDPSRPVIGGDGESDLFATQLLDLGDTLDFDLPREGVISILVLRIVANQLWKLVQHWLSEEL